MSSIVAPDTRPPYLHNYTQTHTRTRRRDAQLTHRFLWTPHPTHPVPLCKTTLRPAHTHACMCMLTHSPSRPRAAGSCSLCQERKLSPEELALALTPLSLHPCLLRSPDSPIPTPMLFQGTSGLGWGCHLLLSLSQLPVIQVPKGRQLEGVQDTVGGYCHWRTRTPAPRVQLEDEHRRLGHCSLSHLLQRGVGLHLGLGLLCCLPAGGPRTSYLTSLSLGVVILK